MPKNHSRSLVSPAPRVSRPERGLALALFVSLVLAGCARPVEQKPPGPASDQKHVYKELKAEEYPVPEGVKKALTGLLNDKIYVYREIAKTVNLVSYEPGYTPESAIQKSAAAFLALAEVPELRKDIEFWIIQVQPPAPAAGKGNPKEASRVVVWGARPEEADAYKQSGDLRAFLRDSEYLLVDDQIIAKGDDRLRPFPSLFAAPAPNQPGPTPGPSAPQPGVVPGNTGLKPTPEPSPPLAPSPPHSPAPAPSPPPAPPAAPSPPPAPPAGPPGAKPPPPGH